MSGFGYNVLGFGASASSGLGVGISLGYKGGPDTWGDMGIQAGDLAIAVKSNLSGGASFTTPTGYTSIATQAASGSWSSPNVEGVALYYKILDGTESSNPSANQWIVVRYAKPVSSVVVSSTSISNSAGINYNYPASTSESVLRVGCSGGYTISGTQRDAWQNSDGNEIASSTGPGSGATTTPAGIIVTTTQSSGTIVLSGGSFIRACIATTITPSA